MSNPLLLASIGAGICFFAWPLRMNQSALSTLAAMFMYASVAFVVALLGIVAGSTAWTELRGTPLRIGAQAGLINTAGMVAFTYMLAHATTTEAPRYVIIVITMQTALTGGWAAYQTGVFDARIAAGLAAALLTVLLLRGGA